MTLGDAIRRGVRERPQGFHAFFTAEGRSCALGAAAEGYGGPLADDRPAIIDKHMRELTVTFGSTLARDKHCPACGAPKNVEWVIAHLNDLHQWTREAIADWLDTLETPSIAQRTPESGRDRELLLRVIDGDHDAAHQLIITHRKSLLSEIRKRVRDPRDVEEVASDVLYALCRAAARYRGQASIRTWLTRIAQQSPFGRPTTFEGRVVIGRTGANQQPARSSWVERLAGSLFRSLRNRSP